MPGIGGSTALYLNEESLPLFCPGWGQHGVVMDPLVSAACPLYGKLISSCSSLQCAAGAGRNKSAAFMSGHLLLIDSFLPNGNRAVKWEWAGLSTRSWILFDSSLPVPATHCRSEELVSPKTVLSYHMRDTGQHKGRDQNPLRYNIRSWDPFNLEIHLGTFCVWCCRISWYMNYGNKLLNNLPIIIFHWINITFVGLLY